MKQHKLKYTVEMISEALDVSKSGCYNWLRSGPSERWLENRKIVELIEGAFEESHQSYGSPIMTAELEKRGCKVSRLGTARMMRAIGAVARRNRKFKNTTDSNHNYPVSPNILNQNFSVKRRNQVWVSDITYVQTTKGWVCLTVIIDLLDRKVIGWSLSGDVTAENTIVKA
jgi:putative transposase